MDTGRSVGQVISRQAIKLSTCLTCIVIFCNLVKGQGQAVARTTDRSFGCVNKTGSLNRSVAAVTEAFSQDPEGVTDIIIIVDMSGSIDDHYFNKMLDFIGYLIDFAAIRFRLYIHPDRGRVEIITFDDNANLEIRNLTDRHVHACEFMDIVKNLPRRNKDVKTQIHTALDAAFLIFSRDVKKRFVVVLTDGEFNDKKEQVIFSSDKLKNIGVTIFTVGLGYYFDEVTKAERIRMLASQDALYACYEDWLKILPDYDGGFDKDSGNLWAEATKKQQKSCSPECSGAGQTCGCNVAAIPPQYGCVCGPQYYKGGNDRCTSCPPDTRKDKVGNDVGLCRHLANVIFSDGEMAGMFLAAIFLILLLLVILFIILICLRRHGRGSHRVNACLDSVYERLGRSRTGSQSANSTSTYVVPNELLMTDEVIGMGLPPAPPKPRVNAYIREPRHGNEDGEDYVNVSPNTFPLPSGDKGKAVHKAKASLFELLAIYDVEGETVQTHNKSRIPRPEMTELLRALRKGKRGYHFVLQRNIYEVKNANANNFMQAEQINTEQTDVKTTDEPSVMWSSNAVDYVVIGVSKAEDSDTCKSTIFDMGEKLRQAKRQA